MRKAFLSYSRSSESAVQQIHDDLLRAGIDEVWYDDRLVAAQDWWDTILQQIRAADVVVCLVDTAMQDSLAVREEYTYAKAVGKPLLPVSLSSELNIASLPQEISSIQHVDYGSDNPLRFEKLVEAIESLPPAAPLPQPLPVVPSAPLSDRDYLDRKLLGGASAQDLSDSDQSKVFRILRSLTLSVDNEEREFAFLSLSKLRSRRELLADIAADIDVLLVRKAGTGLVKTVVAGVAVFSLAFAGYFFYAQQNTRGLVSELSSLERIYTPIETVDVSDASSKVSESVRSHPTPSSEEPELLPKPTIVEESKPVSVPESAKIPSEKEAPAVAEAAIVAAERPTVVEVKNITGKEEPTQIVVPASNLSWQQDFSLFAFDQFDLCGYRDFSVTRSSRTGAATELTVSSKDRSIPDRPFRGFEIKVLSGQAVELLPECIVRLDYYNDTGTARIRVRVRGMQ